MRCVLSIIILPMHQEDIFSVSSIHSEQFPNQINSLDWVRSNLAAYPRIMIFVARNEQDQIVGYVQWLYKGGFCREAVIELEQLAILKNYQNQDIATKLMMESLESVKNMLRDEKCKLKTIIITTNINHCALDVCKNNLIADKVYEIKNLYSEDEALMIRNML